MITNRGIAMDAMHHQRVAQATVGDQLPKRDVLGVEAPHEADLNELLAECLFLLHDRVGRGDVGSQRLLTEHRDAPIQARVDLFRVGRARAGQQHRIDVWIVDRGDRVRFGAGADGSRDLGRLVGEEVVDHGHLGATHPLAQRIHVEGAHHADAENGDPQVVRSWLSPELDGRRRCRS